MTGGAWLSAGPIVVLVAIVVIAGQGRELAEEAGFKAGRLVPINVYYTSKSICDETAYLFLGYDLTRHHMPPDDTEFLEVATFPFDEVLRMVQSSEIRDGMTVIAVLQAALARAIARKEAQSGPAQRKPRPTT